ncbi:MAG: hypothetical protein Q8P35_02735 [Candidatus Yanofskybacteria bacterium]|nr:hypothetical protein [Candidatus Yanofskybacteria bacterium]
MLFLKSKRNKLILALIAIGLVFPMLGNAASGIASNAEKLLTPVYFTIFSISYVILNYAVIVLAFLAQTLNVVIHFQIDTHLPVLEVAWKLIRNFSNMFFIVIMIIMAFGTIFNVGNYYWRSLIGRFIVAALLINFSLVIGQQIIMITQSVNSVFLTAIGDLANQIGQILKPAALLGGSEGLFVSETTAQKASQAAKWLGGILGGAGVGTVAETVTYTGLKIDTLTFFTTMRVLAGLVLTVMVIFSLLVGVIFSLIRIPIIWFLLVISPVAWLANVLPNTRAMNKKWWDYFLAWNFFLPIYLFVLYFGIFFLQQYESIISSLSKYTGMSVITNPLSVGFSIQYLLAYILVAMIFIFGTGLAISGGFWSSSGVLKAAGWAQATAWRIRGFSTGRAIGEAAKLKGEQIKQRGFGIYGGEAAQTRRTAEWAERFRVSGALGKAIGNEKKKMKDENWSTEELQKEVAKGGVMGFAAGELLLDNGDLKPDQAVKIFKGYRDGIAKNAFKEKYLKKLSEQASEGKINLRKGAEGDQDFNSLTDALRTMATKEGERDRLIGRIAKRDSVLSAKLKEKFNPGSNLPNELQETLRKLSAKDIAEQKDGVFKDNDFVEALKTLKRDQITSILEQGELSGEKRQILENALGTPASARKQPIGFDTSQSAPSGSSTGSSGPGPGTISAEVNENNIIDLRKI